MTPKIIKTHVKQILTKTKLPSCDWVINQYVGCGHNCTYCYARFMARWKKFGDWGTWVQAKINAPELLKNKRISGSVFMSSVSDAYQPIEKELQLTRHILENLDKNTELSILTKSDLILRDLDLLKQFKNLEVGFTVNSFNGQEKELFEPDSPTNNTRIAALKILHENNIKTYVFVSPIIPGLIDLGDIINQTRDYASYYYFEVINIRGAGSKFINILKNRYPESYKIVNTRTLLGQHIQELKDIVEQKNIKTKVFITHKRSMKKLCSEALTGLKAGASRRMRIYSLLISNICSQLLFIHASDSLCKIAISPQIVPPQKFF